LEAIPGAVAAPVPDEARIDTRDVWDGTHFVTMPVFEREKVPAGGTFDGPAIVEQYDTTTYVAPGWRATVDAFGNLVLENANA
jgi:N-methylhydantoinase A